MFSKMINSLVGDHQVAVVDVDGGPEGVRSPDFLSYLTNLLCSRHCLKKIMKIQHLLKITFPYPRI